MKFNLDSAGHDKLPKEYLEVIHELGYKFTKTRTSQEGYIEELRHLPGSIYRKYSYTYTIEIKTLKELIVLYMKLSKLKLGYSIEGLIITGGNITIWDGYVD